MNFSLGHGKNLDVGHIGISDEDLPSYDEGPIDLDRWFDTGTPTKADTRTPLELEIGSGKGTFLVQQATIRPDVNYIGLEYARSYWRYAADRSRRHGLKNVRLVRVEAGFFIQQFVQDNCFQCIHIYYPDPWPKTRHHKRRLIQAPFLLQLHRTLAAGAVVRIATDHVGYFEWIEAQVQLTGHAFERLAFSRGASSGSDEVVGTNFERKYRREGRPFHGLVLRKL